MLKNALRRTPGTGTSFICLFCKPTSTTAPLRLSPLRGSSTPAALRTLTTTPQCLKNSTGKRKSKAKAKAKAAAAAAAATPSEESALDEMRKGIDAIVAKQLAADLPKPAKKQAKKGDGRKSVVGEDGKRRPMARMVAGVRKKEMTLAEAMARSGARRRSVGEEEEGEAEKDVAPRPKGLKVIDPDNAALERE
jgi:hypothetical protein